MSNEKDEKNSDASTSEKTSIEVRVEQKLETESAEFSLGSLLGDPQKESIRTRTAFRWFGLLSPSIGAALYGISAFGTPSDFEFSDDAFFTGDEGFEGGADKVGHAYTSYVAYRFLASWIFDYSELSRPRARTYAALSTALFAVTVEVVDGFYLPTGFSWRDLVANGMGIAFAVMLELSPKLDKLLGMSVTYSPSNDFESPRFESDYNGYKYFVNIKMAGVPIIQDTFFQYLQIDLGFFTRNQLGYVDKPDTPDRHFSIGISLDISQVIQSLFKKNATLSTLGRVFEYYHVPAGVTLMDKIVKQGSL